MYFYIDHFVTSRVAKVTYGMRMFYYYNKDDPDHQRWKHLVDRNDLGRERIYGGFHVFVKKVMRKGCVFAKRADFFIGHMRE